jgi:hypothetical protein
MATFSPSRPDRRSIARDFLSVAANFLSVARDRRTIAPDFLSVAPYRIEGARDIRSIAGDCPSIVTDRPSITDHWMRLNRGDRLSRRPSATADGFCLGTLRPARRGGLLEYCCR